MTERSKYPDIAHLPLEWIHDALARLRGIAGNCALRIANILSADATEATEETTE